MNENFIANTVNVDIEHLIVCVVVHCADTCVTTTII